MDKIEDIVADNIRALRNRKRLTQVELADLADVSQQTVQLIETMRRFISPETARKLAGALDCNEVDIFRPHSEMKANLAKAPPSPDLLRELLAALATLDDSEIRRHLDRIRSDRDMDDAILRGEKFSDYKKKSSKPA